VTLSGAGTSDSGAPTTWGLPELCLKSFNSGLDPLIRTLVMPPQCQWRATADEDGRCCFAVAL
jgi:hypothetical protein